MGEYTKKAKGKLKQAVAKVTGDKALDREGRVDEAMGKVEGAAADAKRAAKSAIKQVNRALD